MPRSRTATNASTPSPPTPRCSSSATCSRGAARPRRTGGDRARAPRDVARRRVRGLRRRPAPLAPAGRRRPRPGARRRRRHRPRGARPRRERAAARGLEVATVEADAADFAVPGAAFALILVPMQTIQLLLDAAARAGFFASARRALAPGGTVALALAETPEPFDDPSILPA